MNEITPCPFCLSKQVKLRKDYPPIMGAAKWVVYCQNRDCLAVGPMCATREDAIAKWNLANDFVRA